MRHPFGAALAVVSLLAYCGAAAADFKAGVAAYKASDYATAHKEFMALAERGMAAAQSYLGLMYSRGQGVPQDNPTAAYWYRMAADQGLAVAQHNLGILYKKGDGVPKDDVCQRRSKISPPGRSKTSPLNVMRYAVLGGCPGSP